MEYVDFSNELCFVLFFKAFITRYVIFYFFNYSSFPGHYVYKHIYAYICTYIHTYIRVCMYVWKYLNLFCSFAFALALFSFPFALSASVDWSHGFQDADHSAPIDSVLMKLLRSVKLSICINTFRNKVLVVSRHLNLNIWILLLFDLIVSMTSIATRLTSLPGSLIRYWEHLHSTFSALCEFSLNCAEQFLSACLTVLTSPSLSRSF